MVVAGASIMRVRSSAKSPAKADNQDAPALRRAAAAARPDSRRRSPIAAYRQHPRSSSPAVSVRPGAPLGAPGGEAAGAQAGAKPELGRTLPTLARGHRQ